MNTVTGDIDGNFRNAKQYVENCVVGDTDIIILPETAIAGYCCGALFDNIDFIKEQEEKTKELANLIPPHKCLIIGYVSFHGVKKNGLPKIKNSVLVVNDDKQYVYDKQYLASDNHQEDKKYFEPGKESKVFNIKLSHDEFTIGVPICEDAWYMDHNIPKEMIDMGAELIISINQSYFYYGKQEVRKKLASRLTVPFIYLNTCGVGDIVKNIIIFDGGSYYYNGYNFVELPRFQEYKSNLKFSDFNFEYEECKKNHV